MRRSCSNSTISLEIRYGTGPSFIDIENFEPIVSVSGAFRLLWTISEPSMRWCCRASERTAKMRAAGASMIRSTLTRCSASPMEQLGDLEQAGVDGLQLGDGLGQRHPHDVPGLELHHVVEVPIAHGVDGGDTEAGGEHAVE